MITTIVSFDGTVLSPNYEVGFVPGSEPRLPAASAELLERVGAWPVIVALQRKGNRHALVIRIVGSNRHALRAALFRLFDPEDETPKVLVGQNQAGIPMYVYALCEDLRVLGDQQHDTVFVVTLAVDGDVRWRAVTATSDTWAITASGQTRVITVGGEDDAYPVLTITPTSGKTGGYTYRRWVAVIWRSENAGQGYPFAIELDTATLVGAGKLQADGDDLRVLSDGSTALRWLVDMNTAATQIWTQLNFSRAPALELDVAIAGSGAIASIQVDDEVELSLMPTAGIALIGNEAFTYTGRNLVDKQLTGITRAAKGTSMAAHAAGATVHWIQNDVYLVYGNAAATAGPDLSAYQPAFDLATSTNTSWVYTEFGSGNNARAGRWLPFGPITTAGNGGNYTATELALASPYSVIGAWKRVGGEFAQGWQLFNPCGIVNAAWTGGKVRVGLSGSGGQASTQFMLRYWERGRSFWSTQHNWLTAIGYDPVPATLTWYSQGGAGWLAGFGAVSPSDWPVPAERIAMARYSEWSDFEMSGCTVTLYAAEVPLITVGAEQGNYELACTLTNQETGDAISVDIVMDLASGLEIDTEARTVTWLADNSGQFQALSFSSARRHWLRLLPGENVIRFDDTGTGNVTLVTTWRNRYY